MGAFRDITGRKFGMLTALKVVGNSEHNGKIWMCKCECGNYKNIALSSLIAGTISCGCYQKQKALKNSEVARSVLKSKNLVCDTNLAYLNRKKPIKSNKSGVTGVSFNKALQKWQASISFKKKRYHLGFYIKKEDAIKARKDAEKEQHEKFLEWYNDREKK